MVNPEDLSRGVPFTLSCYFCDCDGPDTHEEALAEGWTAIQFTPDGLAENFLGLCPECLQEDEEELARRRAGSSSQSEPTQKQE